MSAWLDCFLLAFNVFEPLLWIVLGLVCGILAKVLLPGRDPGGLLVTILIGMAGAMLGGWISTQLGFGSVTGFNLSSVIIATGGALVLLIAYRVIRGR